MDIDDFGTNSGGEGDGLCRRRSSLNKLKKAFMQGQLNGNKYALYCGQFFGSSKEVKDKVYLHSIETRRDLKLVRNDKLRVRAMCFGKTLMYTTTSQSHGYENEFFVGPCGSKDPITRKRKTMSLGTDGIPVKAVQDQLQRELELQISVSKAFRAKDKADKEIRGGHECFKAGKRELLGLDEAFMKGLFPGQALSAVGIDANNGIYYVDIHWLKQRSRTLSVGSYRDKVIFPGYNKLTCKGQGQPSNKGAGTLGGIFGNQGQASRSQAVGSQADMVESQVVGSQPANMESE
ncbi:hypothetical protein Tco_0397944 [Tanacetum coccineum]